MTDQKTSPKRVLVIGATGYIGGRLIPPLLDAGYQVRIMVRDPERLSEDSWVGNVEVCIGNLLDIDSLHQALKDIQIAYYLAHSMYDGVDFEKTDRKAAENFVRAAGHLEHVIYLGGLQPKSKKISKHLRSRGEVGRILGEGLPTTEFRAGPIIGSGSASFEMLRHLTEMLPVMVVPYWVSHQVQPLAIRTVIAYLVAAIQKGPLGIVDVGSERLSFLQMIEGFAQVRGLRKRAIFNVPPFLPPRFVGLFISWIIPIPKSLVVPLLEGIVHPILADTEKAVEHFPEVRPISYQDAVKRALKRLEEGLLLTSWDHFQNRHNADILDIPECSIEETWSFRLNHPSGPIFQSFCNLVLQRGWLIWRWTWEFPGFIKIAVLRSSSRPGEHVPIEIYAGDSFGFWHVETVTVNKSLKLYSTMKYLGHVWLQWEIIEENRQSSVLVQRVRFAPSGFWGFAYWHCFSPFHKIQFGRLLRAITRKVKILRTK